MILNNNDGNYRLPKTTEDTVGHIEYKSILYQKETGNS